MKLFLLIPLGMIFAVPSDSAVLDPALYLSPSPPLTSSGVTPEFLAKSTESRVQRDTENLSVVPLEKKSTTKSLETMETADTFWPMMQTTGTLRGINIPLTFSLSGTYGGYNPGLGVIGASYASVSNDEGIFGHYGKGLAGSSYGTYSPGYQGVRVYGNDHKPSWSGWGNGRWGHYGKGK